MPIILVTLLGLCVGSFLNVAIFRVHEGESIVKGRSKCQKCEEPIDARDLIPVLSYLLLKGRCRRCKSVISWQYPAVEAATALLFIATYLIIGPTDLAVLAVNWTLISFLIIIFVYDLKHMYILDKFTIPAMIFILLANLATGAVPAVTMLTGGLVLGGFFLLQFWVSKGKWVGGGDIRLGALMGFALGLAHGLLALFIAYLIGDIVGIYLLAIKKATRQTPVPFGTFLVIGTLISLFFAQPILTWYLGFFG